MTSMTALPGRISGQVISPGDPDYEESRRVYNFMIDRHPAAIVRCADTRDVRAVVDHARDSGRDLAVRGGGHSVPRFGTAAGGSGMNGEAGPAQRGGASDGVALQVIGDCEPVGLCGSGLVDAVASLVGTGLLDHSGRFVTDEIAAQIAPRLAERLVKLGDERVFVLHWRGEPGDVTDSIFLTQRDVRELQFAKAAIASGWNVLLEEAGLTAADVQQVLLAGSFGSYLSPASAIKLGLVPKLGVLRVVSAGNVAGEGAKMALLSVRERAAALALLEEVRYVELSDRADFNDMFVEQLQFPQ